MMGFSAAAVAGFRSSAWIVAAGLAGHGVFMRRQVPFVPVENS